MGAPSTPAPIYTQPSADDKEAAKQAKLEKEAALAKINQDVYARSEGYRGAAGLYDWAGPTPHMAGDPTARPTPPAALPPTTGGGRGLITIPNRPVADLGLGGSPRNTGAVPPSYPLPNTSQGAPRNTDAVPAAVPRPGIGGTPPASPATGLPVYAGGSPRNTGSVTPNVLPPASPQVLSILGVTPRAPAAPAPARPAATITPAQAAAARLVGVTPVKPIVAPMPTKAPVPAQTAQQKKTSALLKAGGMYR